VGQECFGGVKKYSEEHFAVPSVSDNKIPDSNYGEKYDERPFPTKGENTSRREKDGATDARNYQNKA